jgi:hypothetical protein
MGKMRIRVSKQPWFMGLQLMVYETDLNDKPVAVGRLTMETQAIGHAIPQDSLIEIEDSTAQCLMDDLWMNGFRPSEGSGSAGSLKATQNHLEDMRTLVFKKDKKEP